jgi:hypothetical protein
MSELIDSYDKDTHLPSNLAVLPQCPTTRDRATEKSHDRCLNDPNLVSDPPPAPAP